MDTAFPSFQLQLPGGELTTDKYSPTSLREWITEEEMRITVAGKAKFYWRLPEEWKNLARLWYSHTGDKWKRVKVSLLPATGEPTFTVTMANWSEEDLVIPARDRFCWVAAGEEEPEPLNLDQVEEVVGVDDQVQGDVVEPIHGDVGVNAVEGKEA